MTTYIHATYRGTEPPFKWGRTYPRLIFKPAFIGNKIKVIATRTSGKPVPNSEIEYRDFHEFSQNWDVYDVTNNPDQAPKQRNRRIEDE